MIEPYLKQLIDLREGRISLDEFRFRKGTNSEGHTYDQHQKKRKQLLIALQYDRKDSDEALLIELLKAEIEDHSTRPFQGLGEGISLNACLLARFQKVEHIPLFLKAKRANFDTYCGFDYEYLISAGVAEAFEYVDSLGDQELAEIFHVHVGPSAEECHISPAEREEWLQNLQERFPETLVLETPEDELDLAVELEDSLLLQEKLDAWRASVKEWKDEELNYLDYCGVLLNDLQTQIWAREQHYLSATTAEEKSFTASYLIEKLLEDGQWEYAWKVLKTNMPYSTKDPDWKKYGGGRSMVENAFAIVIGLESASHPIALEAFQWAAQVIRSMETANLHLKLLEKIAAAAHLMGDHELAEQFSKLQQAERAKIDQLLNSARGEKKGDGDTDATD